MHGKDEIKSLCQKHVWFLIVAFFPKPFRKPLPNTQGPVHVWWVLGAPELRDPVVPKLRFSGQGPGQGLSENRVQLPPSPWGGPVVRAAGQVTGLIWAPVGDEMGADGCVGKPARVAQPAALGTVFSACHHSQLPKQQSKVTVTRSRGEKLQLGGGAGLTGQWSKNMTASHPGGPSVSSSCPICPEPAQSPCPCLAFVSVLLLFQAGGSSEWLPKVGRDGAGVLKQRPPRRFLAPPFLKRSHWGTQAPLWQNEELNPGVLAAGPSRAALPFRPPRSLPFSFQAGRPSWWRISCSSAAGICKYL